METHLIIIINRHEYIYIISTYLNWNVKGCPDIKCIIFHLITAECRINRNYINSRNKKFQIIYNDKSVNRHDNMTWLSLWQASITQCNQREPPKQLHSEYTQHLGSVYWTWNVGKRPTQETNMYICVSHKKNIHKNFQSKFLHELKLITLYIIW